MKKYRFFYKGDKVLRWEYQPGEQYNNSFFPYVFLKDPNKPKLGYKKVPEWFVREWDGIGEVECLKVKFDKNGKPIDIYECPKLKKSSPKTIYNAIISARKKLVNIDWSQQLKTYQKKMILRQPLDDSDKKAILKDELKESENAKKR